MSERAPIETRRAEITGVKFPERIIELVVVPYEQESEVMYHGRLITETVARGAFDGVERRANRVRALRIHDPERPLGRAVALHPNRQEGLVAEVRIAETHDGDDVLALADEDLMAASIGMAVPQDGMTWSPDRRRRRVHRAFLDHIGLTGDPAYLGAKVLAVRNADGRPEPVATPNIDKIQAWRLEADYSRISNKS